MSIDPELPSDKQSVEHSWALTDAWRAVPVFDQLTMPRLMLPPAIADGPAGHVGPFRDEVDRHRIGEKRCHRLLEAANARRAR
jgi:hypothetical protein